MYKEDERQIDNQSYVDALNALAQSEIPNTEELPTVNVGNYDAPPLTKPYNGDSVMDAARWQTQADVNDFKANRALGDDQMHRWAMENGSDIYFGGPAYLYNRINGSGRMFRNGIEDSYAPSGQFENVPNEITNRADPDYIQRMREKDRQQLWNFSMQEALDALRGLPAYRT